MHYIHAKYHFVAVPGSKKGPSVSIQRRHAVDARDNVVSGCCSTVSCRTYVDVVSQPSSSSPAMAQLVTAIRLLSINCHCTPWPWPDLIPSYTAFQFSTLASLPVPAVSQRRPRRTRKDESLKLWTTREKKQWKNVPRSYLVSTLCEIPEVIIIWQFQNFQSGFGWANCVSVAFDASFQFLLHSYKSGIRQINTCVIFWLPSNIPFL